MPWKRIDNDHWSNNNDRHIFFDRLTKSVTTEYWATAAGVGLVDIPLDSLREFLKDNGFPSFPAHEVEAIQNGYAEQAKTNEELYLELAEIKQLFEDRNKELSTVTSLLKMTENSFQEALKVIDSDTNKIQTQITLRETAEKQKLEIITAAQAEIGKLRAEVSLLKEKYEP